MLIINPYSFSTRYSGDAASFDGTNDYMTRGADLTGNADGKKGTISCWVRLNGGDGTTMSVFDNDGTFFFTRESSNKFKVQGELGTVKISMLSNTSYTAGAAWRHVLAAWDVSASTALMYINDVDDRAAAPTVNNADIDYTRTNHGIGARSAGTQKLNADLFDFWMSLTTCIDISQAANRRLFIDSSGKPVNLGATGANPGVTPICFHHLGKGEAPANFATNRGSGGDFSITGTLTTASGSPTD
jgi:hypothetical protein